MKIMFLLIIVTSLFGGSAFADSWKNLEGNRIVSKWPGRGCNSNSRTKRPPSAAPSYYYNSWERVHGPSSTSTFDSKSIYAFLRHDDLGNAYLLVASVKPMFNAQAALNQQWSTLKVEPTNGVYGSIFSTVVGEDWYKKSQVTISMQESTGRAWQLILPLNIVD